MCHTFSQESHNCWDNFHKYLTELSNKFFETFLSFHTQSLPNYRLPNIEYTKSSVIFISPITLKILMLRLKKGGKCFLKQRHSGHNKHTLLMYSHRQIEAAAEHSHISTPISQQVEAFTNSIDVRTSTFLRKKGCNSLLKIKNLGIHVFQRQSAMMWVKAVQTCNPEKTKKDKPKTTLAPSTLSALLHWVMHKNGLNSSRDLSKAN